MAKAFIVVFNTSKYYDDTSKEYNFTDDDKKRICDYDDRWDVIDELLKDNPDHVENESLMITNNRIVTEYTNELFGYCFKIV